MKNLFSSVHRIGGIIGIVLCGLAICALVLILFLNPSAQSAATQSETQVAGTPTPPATETATPRPTATPTETATPTPLPPVLERVSKCKDSGVTGTLRLAANWAVGDTRTLSITRWRQRYVQRKTKIIVQATTRYRLRVLEATAAGYRLEWLVEDNQVQKGTDVRSLSIDDLFLQDLLTLQANLRIEYSTDPAGAYRQIENWSEVLAFHNQVREIFSLRLEQMYRSKKTRDQIATSISSVWSELAQIDQLYTQQLRAYHAVYGLTVDAAYPSQFLDVQPNLLGYLPLGSDASVRLTTLNAESNCAFLDLRRQLTPDSTKQLLKDYLTRQTRQATYSSAGSSRFSSTRIDDNVRYGIDVGSTWLPSAQMQRRIIVENINVVDGILIADITDQME